MQGGIHPEYTGETYLEILRAVKDTLPRMHVHAFSPLEVSQGAETLGVTVPEFLHMLKEAGLGTLPGTAAEILDDEVRATLCPDKLTTDEWLSVVEAAHREGFRTTSTIMYGHIDRPRNWARHLIRLRELQRRTGGITEFVPLPFVHMEAPIYLKGRARSGPTFREAVLMHAVSRLALHPLITNIQVSWVKMGEAGVKACLAAGANDMGGTLMNESISKAAGRGIRPGTAARGDGPHRPFNGPKAGAAHDAVRPRAGRPADRFASRARACADHSHARQEVRTQAGARAGLALRSVNVGALRRGLSVAASSPRPPSRGHLSPRRHLLLRRTSSPPLRGEPYPWRRRAR